ncbi:MAG: DNA-binding domain-containing protein [Erythrobacter sp.]
MSEGLAERQAAFMQAVLDDNAPLPEGWGNSQAAGMSVYRGNYRSALIGALDSTFERTARYVGEETFKQAAVHHAISHPPCGWTIDEAGAGFDRTCAQLFSDNPEVAELAWLEWTMQEVSTAPDQEPLSAAAFGEASASFDDEAWMRLSLTFQPRMAGREVSHDLTGLWSALEEEGNAVPDPTLPSPRACLVWREGERPTFMLTDLAQVEALALMQQGASYGDLIGALAGADPDPSAIQDAAMQAGAMLGNWLNEGMILSFEA